MSDIVLKCVDLHKRLGKKDILKNVSVEVNEGDILGFIGPNGAGKTTTIKLILGLQSITQGNVIINGYDIEKDFKKAIEKVGAIVENPDLYMYMSGYENLKLIKNLYNNIDENRIQEVIKLVGLEKRIDDKVSKYSLGMRQRLGIAQAILHRPNLLILDEPTNGLDPEGIKEMRELLKKLAKNEKMAVFISSHNLAELESFCNKVCIIKNGEVVETSNISDVKKKSNEECYVFEIDNLDKAKENISYRTEKISSTLLKVYIKKKEIPALIKQLVMNDILIYGIKEDIISLEDAFLKKTGGNVID